MNKFTSFACCTDNNHDPDMTEENSDRLPKMRNLFEMLNKTFSKFYSPSENLAVDKVIVLLKGRVIFLQYIHKKHNVLSSKFTKHMTRLFTYDMTVYCLLIDTNSTQQRLVCPVSESSGVPRGWLGGFKYPPKFRRYRWSPRSHEQEKPASRFSFAVHCVLIRL